MGRGSQKRKEGNDAWLGARAWACTAETSELRFAVSVKHTLDF